MAAEIVGGGLRDFQLAIQCPQGDIAGRNAGHHRQHHAALRLLTGIDLRLRGFAEASDAAEQVDLPGRAQRALVERKVGVGARRQWRLAHAAGARAARVCAVAELRVQLRAGRGQRADELIDARGGDTHIEILAQRGFHQFVQHRVAELLPPPGVRDIDCRAIVDTPCGGRIHRGTLRSQVQPCNRQ